MVQTLRVLRVLDCRNTSSRHRMGSNKDEESIEDCNEAFIACTALPGVVHVEGS